MAMRKNIKTYWHCPMCQYQTDREPRSTVCPACGDGEGDYSKSMEEILHRQLERSRRERGWREDNQ